MNAAPTTMMAPSTSRWKHATLALIVLVSFARLVFLIWLSPYELIGDEAHYWEWSRRPGLSYYTKGPGVAWTIWAATHALGTSEWAIRTPAVLSGAITALCVASLARRISKSGNDARAGFLAACGFMLTPAYQATSLLMTIDAPYVACWALAALLGWIAIQRRRDNQSWALAALACSAVIGVGFLYKYTILLLLPGLLIAAMRSHRVSGAQATRRSATLGTLIMCVVVFLAAISPVLIWNTREGWPTVAHLLGHLGVRGGDMVKEAARPWRYNPMWTLEFIGTQLAMIGPMIVIMALAGLHALKSRDPGPRYCLWCAIPLLAFYFITSFATDVEGNWPVAAYTTLLAPAALLIGSELGRVRAHRRANLVRGFWHAAIIYGIVAGLGMLMLPLVAKLPFVGSLAPMRRLSGHAALAQRVYQVIQTQDNPFIVANRYDTAGLLAFYLPGRPVVRSAAHLMGDRRSSYDYFSDTRLDDPALLSRPGVLVGGGDKAWARSLSFGEVRIIQESASGAPGIRVGLDYRGPVSRTTSP